MMSQRTATPRRRRVAFKSILGLGIALGLGLVSVSEASASTYHVYTESAASSMTLDANDAFCTLAEAVQHASGNTRYNCTDHAPSSTEQRIELKVSPNKPFSTNHFKITSLTLNRQGVRIRIFGSGAFIDSTATYSAFVIPFKSIAFFERVTLTNVAGSAGGRLVENFGELGLYGVTITKGNVTGSQHTTGHGGGIFNRNTQGYPAVISVAQNSLITGNEARKGGGIYNDSGIIKELKVTISNNKATLAGGGIYNFSSTPAGQDWTNGKIVSAQTLVQGNSARAGGGVFNRGLVELLEGSSITGNFTTTTGNSGETCTGSNSCDGLGGGVLSAHLSSGSLTRFQLRKSAFSNNTASARGGAVYSVGILELAANTMNDNKAPDGAAIYVASPTDGSQQYCNVYGNSTYGVATIKGNIANSGGYSIVSGGPGSASDFRECTFGGRPTYMTATGNSSPACNSAAVDSDPNFACPQQ